MSRLSFSPVGVRGAALLTPFLILSGSAFGGQCEFTTPGSSVGCDVPAGATNIAISAWGAGGDGGTSGETVRGAGAGGGGGSYCGTTLAGPLAAQTTFMMTAGEGGAGNPQKDSSVTGGGLSGLVADGGSYPDGFGSIPGVGGSVADCNSAYTRWAGGWGGNRYYDPEGNDRGGGGGGGSGGAGGAGGDGGNATAVGGLGGLAGVGTPPGSAGGTGGAAGVDGDDGAGYGGGGGGAGFGAFGGYGQDGRVLITWSDPPTRSIPILGAFGFGALALLLGGVGFFRRRL